MIYWIETDLDTLVQSSVVEDLMCNSQNSYSPFVTAGKIEDGTCMPIGDALDEVTDIYDFLEEPVPSLWSPDLAGRCTPHTIKSYEEKVVAIDQHNAMVMEQANASLSGMSEDDVSPEDLLTYVRRERSEAKRSEPAEALAAVATNDLPLLTARAKRAQKDLRSL
jgi:hypothetical protein